MCFSLLHIVFLSTFLKIWEKNLGPSWALMCVSDCVMIDCQLFTLILELVRSGSPDRGRSIFEGAALSTDVILIV